MKGQKENNMDKSQKKLLETFIYDNGKLLWKPKRGVRANRQFGSITKHGYRRGGLLGNMYFEHRLVWLYHYGEWPKGDLDHINGIRSDNRVENLREATRRNNNLNKGSIPNTSSNYKGVSYCKPLNKWRAQYTFNCKTKHIGYFETEIEAAKAYDETVKDLHKEFFKGNVYGKE